MLISLPVHTLNFVVFFFGKCNTTYQLKCHLFCAALSYEQI